MMMRTHLAGKLLAAWGVCGVLFLLVQAVLRLAPIAFEAMTKSSLSAAQWTVLAAWVLMNAYMEGYRGFQRSFSPRVVARAAYLAQHPTLLRGLLAPLFCMAMFHARKKSLIVAWALAIGIAMIVVLVKMLPQPYRGIVDAGVVVGLTWGIVSLVVLWARSLFMGRVPPDDSLPESDGDGESDGVANVATNQSAPL